MEALRLLTEMGWPASAAIVGVAAFAGVGVVVRNVTRRNNANVRLQADRDVEIKRLEVGKANGAVALVKPQRESDY